MYEIKYARIAEQTELPHSTACLIPLGAVLCSRSSTFQCFKQTFLAVKNSRIFQQIQFFLDKLVPDETLNLKN